MLVVNEEGSTSKPHNLWSLIERRSEGCIEAALEEVCACIERMARQSGPNAQQALYGPLVPAGATYTIHEKGRK